MFRSFALHTSKQTFKTSSAEKFIKSLSPVNVISNEKVPFPIVENIEILQGTPKSE